MKRAYELMVRASLEAEDETKPLAVVLQMAEAARKNGGLVVNARVVHQRPGEKSE